jgi:hypothetical protein
MPVKRPFTLEHARSFAGTIYGLSLDSTHLQSLAQRRRTALSRIAEDYSLDWIGLSRKKREQVHRIMRSAFRYFRDFPEDLDGQRHEMPEEHAEVTFDVAHFEEYAFPRWKELSDAVGGRENAENFMRNWGMAAEMLGLGSLINHNNHVPPERKINPENFMLILRRTPANRIRESMRSWLLRSA